MSVLTPIATVIGYAVLAIFTILALISFLLSLWEVKISTDEVLAAFPEDNWALVNDLIDRLRSMKGLVRRSAFSRDISRGQIHTHLDSLEEEGRLESRVRAVPSSWGDTKKLRREYRKATQPQAT